MTQVNYRFWLLLGLVLLIAAATFGVLSLLISPPPQPNTRAGTINPDATMQQVIDSINQWTVNTWGQLTGQIDNIDLDLMLQDLLTQPTDSTHNASTINYDQRTTTLCKKYASICDITDLKWSYTPRQMFAYQLMLTYMITTLEKFGYDPLVSLESITIDNFTNTRRGYANARLMVINTYQIASYKEYLQVLAHELWHVIDLGVIQWRSSQINTSYTEFGKAKFQVDDPSLSFYAISWSNENTLRAGMWPKDFVSGYGMSNPFEDFAETNNMYLYHREVFVYLASSSPTLLRKYNYFQWLFQSQFLSNNFNPTDLRSIDLQFRSWDTTRM